MERYKEYKKSVVPGMKEIPSHWKEILNGILFKENVRKPNENDIPLSLSQKDGLIPTDLMKESSLKTSTYDNWKKVLKHDLVLNRFKAHLGVLMASDYEGMVSFHYGVYEPQLPLITKYYELLYHTDIYKGIYAYSSNGMTVGLQNLSNIVFYSIKGIYPPLAEQEKIVSSLEDKTSKIDAYVADKEKEIELLQELKQKTIADAVTKGLNPDAKMKDYSSLISSSCPEHWKIVRNKSFLSLTGEKVGKKASEYVLLSLTTKGVIVRDIESGKGKFPKDFDTYQIVKPNELVFCLFDIDETPRTVGLVETEGMLTGAYTAFKVYTELAIPEYIYNYYLCVDNIKALKPYYSGLRKTVRADKFQQIYMPLPPLDEQQAIVAYIEKKCEKIDKLVSELQSEIDYLKEYKQRLIADCVTGQINVQNEMI